MWQSFWVGIAQCLVRRHLRVHVIYVPVHRHGHLHVLTMFLLIKQYAMASFHVQHYQIRNSIYHQGNID